MSQHIFPSLYKKNFLMVMALLTGVYCVAMVYMASTSMVEHYLSPWFWAAEYVALIYPVLVSVPFCLNLFLIKKTGYIRYIESRCEIGDFLIANYKLGVACAFSSLFIMSIVGLVITGVFFGPLFGEGSDYASPFSDYFFFNAVKTRPFLTALVFSVWRSFLGAMFFSFGFLMSLLSNNVFIAMSAPFVYSIVENYITGVLGFPQNSICTAFHVMRMGGYVVHWWNMLVGPILFLIVQVLLLGILLTQKRRNRGWSDTI